MAKLAPESDTIAPSDVAASIVVPYPPPPAKIETVPPAPSHPDCVYLDGQWVFGARDWQWQPGAWVIARGDCSFAAGRLFWQKSTAARSELRSRAGHWVVSSNPTIECPPAQPCPGSTTTNS